MPAGGLLKRTIPADTGLPWNVTWPEMGESFGPLSPQPDKQRANSRTGRTAFCITKVLPSVAGNGIAVVAVGQIEQDGQLKRFGKKLDRSIGEQCMRAVGMARLNRRIRAAITPDAVRVG